MERIGVHFLHSNGMRYTWQWSKGALIGLLRDAMPEEIEDIKWVELPNGTTWLAPECERAEQARLLLSILEHS